MTERWLMIVAIAVLTYAMRYSGFLIGGGRTLPQRFERFLEYVPIAAFAALVAPGVADGPGLVPSRLLAVVVAAITGLWLRRLWASLLLGMSAFWLADFVFA